MPLTPIEQPRFNMDLRTQGYVFTVAIVAAVFIGLLFFRPFGAVRVAETQVWYEFSELTTDRGVPIDPLAASAVKEHMVAEVTSKDFLEPIIDRVGLAPEPLSADFVTELARKISVEIVPDGDAAFLVAMRFESPNPTVALSFAEGMANRFVARHNKAAVVESARPPEPKRPSEERTFAQASIEQWEQRIAELKKDQQSFVQQQMEQLESQHPARDDFSWNPLDRVAGKPAQAFIRLPKTNPHWLKLQNELRMAQQQIAVMLETYTPEHPALLQRFAEVEALRQELGRTSRTVSANERTQPQRLATSQAQSATDKTEIAANVNRDGQFDPTSAGDTASEPSINLLESSFAGLEPSIAGAMQPPEESTVENSATGDEEQVATNVPRVAAAKFDPAEALLTIKSSPEYRQLAAKLQAATEKLEHSRRHLVSLPIPEPPQPVADVVVTTKPESSEVRAPARITSVLRPPFTSANALQLFGPATLFAFVLSIARRSTRLPAFLCSEEDVANTLALPIVSGVSQPKGPIFEMPENTTPRLVVVGIRVCEVIAAIGVMLIVMGLVTQPDFASHMTSNPIDAFCIGLDHLQAFIARCAT